MEEILVKYRKQLFLALGGLILTAIGFLSFSFTFQKEPEIEIFSSEEQKEEKIFVYLEGAVEKPGVYELPEGARLNALLILAGGLSAEADREWVAQNLNLAQKLVDSAKIYIPERSEVLRSLGEGGQASDIITSKINLNQASSSQLESLWGIGEKRAADIIKNRPYQTVEELLTRKIIPKNVYEEIKEEITVY